MCRVGGDDEADGHLVADRVGLADDSGFEHGGVGGENLLDLDRRHILTGHLQHVCPAPVEVEPAVRIAPCPVTREEPAILVRRLGRLRVVEVAGEQRDPGSASDGDLTDLVGIGLRAVRSLDPYLAPLGDEPHRRRHAVVGAVGQHGRDRLGHPVELPR